MVGGELNMFKKGNNIFSLLIIILSVLMTSSSYIVKADNTDTGTASTAPKDWGDSLITKAELQNADGTPLTDASTNKTMRAYWKFSYKKDSENSTIQNGDTMTVKVPEQLAVNNDLSGQVFQVGNPNEPIGDLHLDKNTKTITVTFNQHAADLSKTSNIVGSFWIEQISWNVNTDFSKPIVLNWTTKGSATNPDEPGLSTTINVSKPTLPDSKEILFKYGGFDGTTIAWTVRINYRKDDIKNAVYKDTIGPNQKLLIDDTHPIIAYPATFDQTTGAETDDTSNGSIIKSLKTDDTGFTANLGDITQTVILKYYTQTNAADSSQMDPEYGNTGDLLSNTTELQNITTNLTTNKLGGSATANTSITAIVGTKLWDLPDKLPDGLTKPSSVTIDLLKSVKDGDQDSYQKVSSQTVSDDNNWTYRFYNLPQYEKDGSKINYTVQEEPDTAPGFTGTVVFPDSTQSTTLQNIVNTVTPDPTKFTVTKVWNDGNLNHDNDSIELRAFDDDGKRPSDYSSSAPDSITLSKDKGWTGTFENLPKLTAPNRWYVSEYNTPDNYISTDSYPENGNNYNKVVTNTLATTLTVNKVWNDGKDKNVKDPTSVDVQMYQSINDKDYTKIGDSVTLSATNNWTHTFEQTDPNDSTKTTTKFPAFDAQGNPITYRAEEVKVPDGYEQSISFDNNDKTKETITNTRKSTTTPTDNQTTFHVSKIWNDNSNANRPTSIQVQLLADGQKSGSPVTLNKANNWTYNWDKLDKTANDKDIKYTVEEVNVPTDYTSSITTSTNTSATITNTLKNSGGNTGDITTNLNVTKIWSDNNNQDNLRPDHITIHLLKNGTEIDSATLNADNNWDHNFTGLDKNSSYLVTEDKVANYTTNIDNINSTNIQITNTHTPATTTTTDNKTNLTVKKSWNDQNNQDNLRPNQVTVHILKNGKIIGQPVTLSSLNAWSYTWNDLDKNGKYTVQEDTVAGYTTTQSSSNGVITITNKHNVTKTPDNPGTPTIPGGNNDNHDNSFTNNNGGGDSNQNNPGNGDGSNTTTNFTPDNPMVPSPIYQQNNPKNGLLPQTGAKDTNIIYSIVGLLLLGLITAFGIKRKQA